MKTPSDWTGMQVLRTCAVISCEVKTDLVAIGTTFHKLRIDFYICQKHLGGKK